SATDTGQRGAWMIATPLRYLLRRRQAMTIRWLGSFALSVSLSIGVATADDGWRPAGCPSKTNGSGSASVASGSLGVTLGRPVPMDAPADLMIDKPDSNVLRASYETTSTPPLYRFQSPEVPQPLPPGPAAKTGNAAANP